GALEVVVDRVTLRDRRRLSAALEEAWRRGAERASVHLDDGVVPTAEGLVCPSCSARFDPPASGLFSYESALGACGACRGFGRVMGIDWRKVVPDERLSLARGAIRPWTGKKAAWERRQLAAFCEREGIDHRAPWSSLTAAERERIFAGDDVMRRNAYPGVR